MFDKTVTGDYGTAKVEQTGDTFWIWLNGTPIQEMHSPHQALIFARKVANNGY